jgi:hypothetical protein
VRTFFNLVQQCYISFLRVFTLLRDMRDDVVVSDMRQGLR